VFYKCPFAGESERARRLGVSWTAGLGFGPDFLPMFPVLIVVVWPCLFTVFRSVTWEFPSEFPGRDPRIAARDSFATTDDLGSGSGFDFLPMLGSSQTDLNWPRSG
jgi:hypothetical protein